MTSPPSPTVVETLIELARPRSILDVESVGPWSRAFRNAGVEDVVTVRGPTSRSEADSDGDAGIIEHDFRYPFRAGRPFDLAVCIGGGAELPASAAPNLVATLCDASPVVAFAAPQPGLAAPGTPNPRWPAWWDSLFELHGLRPHDIVRPLLWDDDRVDIVLRQALVLYAPSGRFAAAAWPERAMRSAVHPEAHHRALGDAERQYRSEVDRLNAALLDADVDAGGLRQLVRELRDQLERLQLNGPEPGPRTREEWRVRAAELEERAALLAAARNVESRQLQAYRERVAAHKARARNLGVLLTRAASEALPVRRRLAALLGPPAYVFDEEYYQQRYPDLARSRMSPLWHFRLHGSKDVWSPHRLFDAHWYLECNPDVAAAGQDPLSHYVRYGWKEGREPHPMFDGAWYASKHDLGGWNRSPLEHFLERGRTLHFSPHPLFDAAWYLEHNADALDPGEDAFSHFDQRGWMEGRDPHPLFDVRWYLARHPDAVNAAANPLEHYLRVGWRAGRDPNPMFDIAYYREVNRALLGDDEEPLGHYVREGAGLGLSTSRLFDGAWYEQHHPEAAESGDPLAYFLKVGAPLGHRGTPDGYDHRTSGTSEHTPQRS